MDNWWYWWFAIVFGVWVVSTLFKKRKAQQQSTDGPTTGSDRRQRGFMPPEPSTDSPMFVIGSSRRPRGSMRPELKPYLTQLCRVYKTNGSFAHPETKRIGQEIHEEHGHSGMVAVCDELSYVLGGAAARDLEYKWDGIGEWLG